jgi:hypothetical protein
VNPRAIALLVAVAWLGGALSALLVADALPCADLSGYQQALDLGVIHDVDAQP